MSAVSINLLAADKPRHKLAFILLKPEKPATKLEFFLANGILCAQGELGCPLLVVVKRLGCTTYPFPW